MQSIAQEMKARGLSVGFVPTMGALHEGHLTLVSRAKRENDIVVVSIFVNPTQFGPNEDYLRYPRPFLKDKRLCAKSGVDYIFHPGVNDMYPPGAGRAITYVNVDKMAEYLCGPLRPGHFRGVATVVAKLFNIALPDRAYFGMKDYQQLRIIGKMAQDLNFPVKIVPVPTVRESDGLAMSSRNRYLKPSERAQSLKIFKSLQQARDMLDYSHIKSASKIKQAMRSMLKRIPNSRIEYVEISDAETLEPLKTIIKLPVVIAVAVRIGRTRLIDNIVVK